MFSISSPVGASLDIARALSVRRAGEMSSLSNETWRLLGTVSNLRYAKRSELTALRDVQPALSRPQATRAALIPIRKSEAWWGLPQDERRAIFEETSQHTWIGLNYLPAVARRLHHSRDLGEPFDFLTWFEFAPEHEAAFDELLARLRATPGWDYVEREVDIRLARDQTTLSFGDLTPGPTPE